MNEISKTKKLFILTGAVFLILTLVFLAGFFSKKPKKKSLKLVIWGLDSPAVINQVLAPYQEKHPYLDCQYQQKNEKTYYQELIDSFGTAETPDIFVIKNTWLDKFKKRIVPFNLQAKEIKKNFVEVVWTDAVREEKVWGLPNSIDTLVLAYNLEKFNQRGIALPPKTWQEFIEDANLLKEIDETGKIVKPGASLGSVDNIENFFDILSLIMLQKGVQITSLNKESPSLASQDSALKALNFYLQFAEPKSANYAWDKSLKNSLDSFAWLESPMIFVYQKDIKRIKEKNPKLIFEISQVPQFNLSQPVSYSSYYLWAVSWKKNWPEAQKLVEYLTLGQGAKDYLNLTKKPPALRFLIKETIKDPDLKVFSYQALIAKSYWQPDPFALEKIFKDMVKSVLSGKEKPIKALRIASERISLLTGKKR